MQAARILELERLLSRATQSLKSVINEVVGHIGDTLGFVCRAVRVLEPHSLNSMCRSKPAPLPRPRHEPKTSIVYFPLPALMAM